MPPTRQAVTSSRTFGTATRDVGVVCEAVATFVVRAAAKLRRHGLAAGGVTVFVQTDRFRTEKAQHAAARTCRLPAESDDTPELIGVALRIVRGLLRPGFEYRKAGVMLTELVRRDTTQRGLFDEHDRTRSAAVMAVVDAMNAAQGRDTLTFGAAKLRSTRRAWPTKFDRLSPAYTTRWSDLAVARAD